jgi:hypothetical protein
MKKITLIILLTVAWSNMYAFTTQGSWRWRKDDGSQTTATWMAAQNVTPTITSPTETLRLRIVLYNDPANAGGLLDGALFEDSSNLPGSHWDTIKLTVGTNAFVLAGTSTNVTDLQATTDQLTAEGLTFVAGKMILATEKLPAQTVAKNKETEYEYVIKPTANLQSGTTYYFRVDAANYPVSKTLPSIITGSLLPIQLAQFTVKPDGNKVKIDWITASEQNNAQFDIERSTDGVSWTSVAKVKGSGNTSTPTAYSAVDIAPANGTNFYRIKQTDMDGKSRNSEVKSLRMLVQGLSKVNLVQNPVKDAVRVSINDVAAGKISLVLSALNGKTVYNETIQVAANGTYTLGLKQMPAPGMYILHVKGDAIDETLKLMVQ